MKLGVGKFYVTRDKRTSGPMRPGNDPAYPIDGLIGEEGHGGKWAYDGCYLRTDEPSALDLIHGPFDTLADAEAFIAGKSKPALGPDDAHTMTRRDQFAMAALPALSTTTERLATEDSIAETAYMIADAMEEARSAVPGPNQEMREMRQEYLNVKAAQREPKGEAE